MKKDCSRCGEIIEKLISEINEEEKSYDEIRELNPGFEQVSEESWKRKEGLFWIHGETDPRKTKSLEEWLYVSPPTSDTAESIAMDNYLEWGEHVEENGVYSEFTVHDLPKPYEKELLIEYITRLSQMLNQRGFGNKKQDRALRCFLQFLRDDYHQEAVAFIEHIIPHDRELKENKIRKKILLPNSFPLEGFNGKVLVELKKWIIVRKVPPQIDEISTEIAGELIRNLAYKCAFGRPNSRHRAAETLAMLWLCLTSSRIRWPRSVESVYALEKDAISFHDNYAELFVPSYFGHHPVRISLTVADFLQAVAEIPSKTPRKTILQTSLENLRGPLRLALNNTSLPPDYGEVSFLTFLRSPHYFGREFR